MELTINDLGVVYEAVYEVRAKALNLGLQLKVQVDTLDSIEDECKDPSNKLREVLKAWLKRATKSTWQNILDALKSSVVGEPKLASEIEAKHCTAVEVGQAGGQTMLLVQPQQVDTKLQTPLQEELQLKKQKLQDSQKCMDTLQQKLQDSQRQNQQLTYQVKELKQEVLQHERTNQELRAANDQLRQELRQAVEDKQIGQRQLQELEQQLKAMKQARIPGLIEVIQQKTIQDMKWHRKSKAPEKMRRGSAASDSNVAYFNGFGSTKVHRYDSSTQQWHQLPDAPFKDSTLVVVQHTLTMVGGSLSGKVTNSLLSLMGEGGAMKWLPHYPAMPTARGFAAAVCSGHSLIVAGGSDGHNLLATVEVLTTDVHQWSTACSLPHPFSLATISICGEQLYLMGGYRQIDPNYIGTYSVLTCSVHELLQCQSQPLAGKRRTAPAKQTAKWQHVADIPHHYSSCATLCGRLVAVGGGIGDKDTAAMFMYNETADSWEAMGDMPTARRLAQVAILNGKLMVIGGRVEGYGWTDVVEILY